MAIEVSDTLKELAVSPLGNVPMARIEVYPISGVVSESMGLRRRVYDGVDGLSPSADKLIYTDYSPMISANFGTALPLGVKPNMLTDRATYSIIYDGYVRYVRPAGVSGMVSYKFGYVSTGYSALFINNSLVSYGSSRNAIKESNWSSTSFEHWVPIKFYFLRGSSETTKRIDDERFTLMWQDDIDNAWRVVDASVSTPALLSFQNLVGDAITSIGNETITVEDSYLLTITKVGDRYYFYIGDDSGTLYLVNPGQTEQYNLITSGPGICYLEITWGWVLNAGDKSAIHTDGFAHPYVLSGANDIETTQSNSEASTLRFTIPVTIKPFEASSVDMYNATTYDYIGEAFGVLKKGRLIKAYLGYRVGGQPEMVNRFTGFINDISASHTDSKMLTVTCIDPRNKALNAPAIKVEDMVLAGLPNDISYDVIDNFTNSHAGADGVIRPKAFDKWYLSDIVRAVLYANGFMSGQLWARDSNGNLLIEDRRLRLDFTPAYPFTVRSVVSGQTDTTSNLSMYSRYYQLETQFGKHVGQDIDRINYGFPSDYYLQGWGKASNKSHWTLLSETQEADYLYTLGLDEDPWGKLAEMCQDYGLELGINAEGNVYLRYPNNPVFYNTYDGDTDNGTAETIGSSDALYDSEKTWHVDEWKNGYVKITGGTGSGQSRKIVTNDATQLVVSPNWSPKPDGTSEYVVAKKQEDLDNSITYGGGWTLETAWV